MLLLVNNTDTNILIGLIFCNTLIFLITIYRLNISQLYNAINERDNS